MYVPSFTFKSRSKLGNDRTVPLEKVFFAKSMQFFFLIKDHIH